MQPPFTLEEFLGVFARYNLAVWPLQVGLYAVAALLVALAARPSRRSGRWIAGLLAALWAWMGIVYHWAYFARINPAAYLSAVSSSSRRSPSSPRASAASSASASGGTRRRSPARR